MTTDVGAIDADAQRGDQLEPLSVYRLSTTVTSYETYIPLTYIDAPEDGIRSESGNGVSDYWFAGDTRTGPQWQSGKHRTDAMMYHFWAERDGSYSKHVHTTKRYRKVGSSYYCDSQRLVSGYMFNVRQLQNDGRYTRTVVEHSVGNPYCVAAIDYANQQDLYQNGSHSIYGSHDKMPSHQFYRQDWYSNGSDSYSATDLVFNHKYAAPECLGGIWGGCTTWQYQYTR